MCPRRKTLELKSPTPSPGTHISTPFNTAKANKLLGLLKRTRMCPLLNDVSARCSLYLALVKSQLSYATQVWSDFKFDIRRNSSFHSYQTRRSNDSHLPRVRNNWGKKTFIYQASKNWNNLDNDIKNSKSLSFFKANLKSL